MLVPQVVPEPYEAHVKESFAVFASDGSTSELVLDEVTRKIEDDVQRCFVLRFSGAKPVLPQGMYRIAHGTLGEFELFLVPLQPRRDRAFYEAVFNLLKEGTS